MNAIDLPAGYAAPRREPHCGVLAVAICANVSFESAFDWIKAHAGYRGNWKGRTYATDRRAALDHFGATYRETSFTTPALLRQHGHPAGWAVRCTVAAFAKRHAKPGALYLVNVRGHTFTLRNGIMADQSGVRAAPGTRLARCHVTSVMEITSHATTPKEL